MNRLSSLIVFVGFFFFPLFLVTFLPSGIDSWCYLRSVEPLSLSLYFYFSRLALYKSIRNVGDCAGKALFCLFLLHTRRKKEGPELGLKMSTRPWESGAPFHILFLLLSLHQRCTAFLFSFYFNFLKGRKMEGGPTKLRPYCLNRAVKCAVIIFDHVAN